MWQISTTLWTSTGCTHSAIESIDTVGERARGNYSVREVSDSDSVAPETHRLGSVSGGGSD